jgi:2-polyprenyl-3-methyl-5-hydroxy-6-metoxy-1,4-benzoquinol methylase
MVLAMLQAAGADGPVLDVGCATGGLISRLIGEGYDTIGVDQSQWAVDIAVARLGEERVFQCNVETDAFPSAMTRVATYGAIVLWAVYEHFRDPPAVLARITSLARPGTILLINTTNAESLSHLLFGRDWEGYYDWTHHGVDTITVSSLRAALQNNGWRVESLKTHAFWHAGADPEQALFRNLETNDSRFRHLLEARDLGDFIVCAAKKL